MAPAKNDMLAIPVIKPDAMWIDEQMMDDMLNDSTYQHYPSLS